MSWYDGGGDSCDAPGDSVPDAVGEEAFRASVSMAMSAGGKHRSVAEAIVVCLGSDASPAPSEVPVVG